MQPVPKEAAARPLIAAIICYGLFWLLGTSVSHRGPGAVDLWSRALVRHGDLTAWVLSWSVYVQWLVPLCIVLGIVAAMRPRWRARIIFSLVMLLAMWGASDLFQHLYMRPRPTDWIVKHETAYSYPSTHATLAVAFYGLWAYFIWTSSVPRPRRAAISGVLAAFVLAIFWARLELGAHHPTDILGGALLGLAGICLGHAICAFFGVRLAAQG